MVAQSALDSLAVVFTVWRMVADMSTCGAPGRLGRIWVCVCRCGRESLHVVWPSPVQNSALVVLVEVLPGLACVASTCCSVLSDDPCCLVIGLCILVNVLPRIILCRFWRRFFPGVLCVHFGPPLCCPYGSKCAVWLGYVLVMFSQDGSWRFWWRFSPRLLRWDYMSPWPRWFASFLTPGVLSQMVV
ncbi:hypothetical protein Taro_038855 [Colocasia esculenta]|uniref:Uncharacterized protein n=1 Tax=Colocasia esculenta TaxID=4460 RepID=A0A843WF10_COLES|nr:hypothetical protein [Colocasia esculenta]